MSEINGYESPYELVNHLRVQNPEDGVVLRSNGWAVGSSGGWTTFECKGCGAYFHWPSDPENKWLPNRRHLKHCPGCGKTITGFEIPSNR